MDEKFPDGQQILWMMSASLKKQFSYEDFDFFGESAL